MMRLLLNQLVKNMLHINIKDLFLTFLLLLCAFVMSLFLYYIFDVREHIATVFVFAVF